MAHGRLSSSLSRRPTAESVSADSLLTRGPGYSHGGGTVFFFLGYHCSSLLSRRRLPAHAKSAGYPPPQSRPLFVIDGRPRPSPGPSSNTRGPSHSDLRPRLPRAGLQESFFGAPDRRELSDVNLPSWTTEP